MEQQIELTDYFSHQKLKITGNYFHFSNYGKEFRVGKRKFLPQKKEDIFSREETELTDEELRLKTFYRARRMLIDYINTNINQYTNSNNRPYPAVFLTLTFKENLTNVFKANYFFTKFIQRLNWEVTKSKKQILKYISIIEFQKRGAVHYHVIFFNLPYIPKKKLEEIWGRNIGFIKIKKIDEAKNVGQYVTKYLSKDFANKKLKGKKCFFVSKGILKPIITNIEEVINLIHLQMPSSCLDFEKKDIPLVYLRNMDIQRYNLRLYPELKEYLTNYVKNTL